MKIGLGQHVTSHLKWEEFRRVLDCLDKDGEIRWKCTIALGVFFTLRVSDLTAITWDQLWQDGQPVKTFEIWEKKTRNTKITPQKITLSQDAIGFIQELHDYSSVQKYVFSPHFNKPATERYINYNLKRIFEKYNVQYHGCVSSHLFRKTFGYRYAEIKDFSAESLIHLNRVYRHKTVAQTMTYLGINKMQIADVFREVCKL